MHWAFYVVLGLAFYYFLSTTEFFTESKHLSFVPCKRCRLLNASIAQTRCEPICKNQNGIFTGKYKSVNITDGLCECELPQAPSQTTQKQPPPKELDALEKKNLSKSFFAFTKTRKTRK